MSRRISGLMRRGGRAGVGGGGAGASAASDADVVIETGWSAANGYSATSNFNPALDVMTLCGIFRGSDPTAVTTRMFSKGAGGGNGYTTKVANTANGILQIAAGTNKGTTAYNLQASDSGRLLLYVWTTSLSTTQLWMREFESGTMRLVSEVAGGAAVTNSAGPSIGGYQTGTAGTLAQPFEDGIIGLGYGNAFLTPTQVQTLGDAMAAQGTVPTDAAFVGGVSVYQSAGAGGMGVDQLGSGDIASLGTTTVGAAEEAIYAGKRIDRVLLIGQSNAESDTPFGEFVLTTDYTAAYPACGYWKFGVHSAFGDLNDSGAATGTGAEVGLGRVMTETGRQIVKYAVFGTNAHTNWEPVAGAQYIQLRDVLKVAIDAYTATPPLNRVACDVLWIQGENDANDATNSAAYGTNEATIIDAFLTDFADWIDLSTFKWISARLSATYQTSKNATYLASVNSGKDTNATARAYYYTLNTEACTGNVSDDNLHYGAGSLVGIGNAAQLVRSAGANQTVVVVT